MQQPPINFLGLHTVLLPQRGKHSGDGGCRKTEHLIAIHSQALELGVGALLSATNRHDLVVCRASEVMLATTIASKLEAEEMITICLCRSEDDSTCAITKEHTSAPVQP